MEHLIEIAYKPNVFDPKARAFQDELRHLRVRRVRRVSTSQLYRLVGDIPKGTAAHIAERLLTDPVIQLFLLDAEAGRPWRASPEAGPREALAIDVWLKPGVTDVVGESVLKGLADLGITGVSEVRAGQRYLLEGALKRRDGHQIARSLLVNPLIHGYRVDA